MITYEPRDPATVERPPPGKYRLFCTEDGRFARMDSEGNIATLPFAEDLPSENVLPLEITQRKISGGFIDGAVIGRQCRFIDGAATLAAMGLRFGGATTAAEHTTTSGATYADLTVPDTGVTLVTGTTAFVIISAIMTKVGGSSGFNGWMSVEVSGATTMAATDDNSTYASAAGGGLGMALSRAFILTGLTPGENTFTPKYRDNGWTFAFSNRSIVVVSLP